MSELKEVEYPNCFGSYYRKDEADKVISELEMKLAAAQQVLRLNKPEALYSNLETMGRLKHQIDVVERRELHQKRKRCLAMAKYCELKEDEFGGDFAKRWLKRWLALAEKFKLNKSTAR